MSTSKRLSAARTEMVRNFLVILRLSSSPVYHRVTRRLSKKELAVLKKMAAPDRVAQRQIRVPSDTSDRAGPDPFLALPRTRARFVPRVGRTKG